MSRIPATPHVIAQLQESLASSGYIEGLTHGFYHYPARFSPAIARTVIERFSRRNDWVMDPFMGGGTAVVEALAHGRRMIGIDINPLAHFVASVRTTPLSPNDEEEIRSWAKRAAWILEGSLVDHVQPMGVHNLPDSLDRFMSAATLLVDQLDRPRQRAFVRCLLLRLGQWALDCRESMIPRRHRLIDHLITLCTKMLTGLSELVDTSKNAGVPKDQITSRRILLNRTSVGLESDNALSSLDHRPRLVITSPPYPGVHVLYHRWQYKGRKETAAPYHIAAVEDGSPAKYYTAGSRTPTGLVQYFTMIEQAFQSIGALLSPHAMVIQLVGFSDPTTQLPRYSRAMERAGFEPWRHPSGRLVRLSRAVHNRRWYHRIRAERAGSTELLLIHTRS